MYQTCRTYIQVLESDGFILQVTGFQSPQILPKPFQAASAMCCGALQPSSMKKLLLEDGHLRFFSHCEGLKLLRFAGDEPRMGSSLGSAAAW